MHAQLPPLRLLFCGPLALAPLLLSLLLLVASSQRPFRRLAVVVGVVQLATAGAFLADYRHWTAGPYTFDRSVIEPFERTSRRILVFRPGQDPWCNTLAAARYPFFFPEMVGLTPGIGVTMLGRPPKGSGTRPPLKSKYVLFDRRGAPPRFTETPIGSEGVRLQIGRWAALNLKHLADTSVGGLYLNLDAHCPAD